MKLLLKWLIYALVIMIASYIIPGVIVSGFWAALVAALVLGLINAVLKPIFILLTLPINILTLGLFTFVINALLILLTSAIVKGFYVHGFLAALLLSLLLTLTHLVLQLLNRNSNNGSW